MKAKPYLPKRQKLEVQCKFLPRPLLELSRWSSRASRKAEANFLVSDELLRNLRSYKKGNLKNKTKTNEI